MNTSLPMTTRERKNRRRKEITPRIEASSRTVEERKASAKHCGEDSKRQAGTGLSQGSERARATENHIFTIDGLQAPFQTLVDRPGPGRDRTGRGRVCQAHWVVTRPSEAETGKGGLSTRGVVRSQVGEMAEANRSESAGDDSLGEAEVVAVVKGRRESNWSRRGCGEEPVWKSTRLFDGVLRSPQSAYRRAPTSLPPQHSSLSLFPFPLVTSMTAVYFSSTWPQASRLDLESRHI